MNSLSEKEYPQVFRLANEAVAQAVLGLEGEEITRSTIVGLFLQQLQASTERCKDLADSRQSSTRQKILEKDALDSQYRGIAPAFSYLR